MTGGRANGVPATDEPAAPGARERFPVARATAYIVVSAACVAAVTYASAAVVYGRVDLPSLQSASFIPLLALVATLLVRISEALSRTNERKVYGCAKRYDPRIVVEKQGEPAGLPAAFRIAVNAAAALALAAFMLGGGR